MKNKIILILGCLAFIWNTKAQLCIDIPISYSIDSVYFTSADGFGDSMVVFTMLNEHATQGFAYPQAKLEPISPLPSGMSINSINDPWAVYASSWNPGQYSPVHIYYDVNEAIPEDYTVSFKLWINNLAPVTDSCFFEDTITINLNPSATTGILPGEKSNICIYPNPVVNGNFTISNLNIIGDVHYTVHEISGKRLKSGTFTSTGIISVSELPAGLYIIMVHNADTVLKGKIVVE